MGCKGAGGGTMTRKLMKTTLKTFSIYALRDIAKDKIVYIGQTRKLLCVRLQKHFEHARKPGGRNIAEYININGPDNFSIESLQICHSQNEADVSESKWIAEHGTLYPSGCNVWPGSVRGSRPEHINRQVGQSLLGHSVSEETRRKIRQARALQAPISKEGREKISETHKGKKLSDAHRAKIKASWDIRRLKK